MSSPAKPADVFISIGSNIAPHENVPKAVASLKAVCEVLETSTFYRTAAVGPGNQPEYRNGAVHVRTNRPATEFQYGDLRGIERDLGRVRTEDRYAARPIDLDVVLYGQLTGAFDGLTLPAPDLFTRAFVAVPMAELLPEATLPGCEKSLADIARGLSGEGMTADPELSRRVKEIVHDE